MSRTRLLILALALLLNGCTTVVHKVTRDPIEPTPSRTSLGTSIDDFQTETLIGVNIKKAHPELEKANINIHSYNGVILLTGQVPSDSLRATAGQVARDFRGVRLVHNELQTGPNSSFASRSSDSWLGTKVRTRLIAEKDLDAGAIKVIVEDDTVFLMGLTNRQQADRAATLASRIRGVERVVKAFEYLDVSPEH